MVASLVISNKVDLPALLTNFFVYTTLVFVSEFPTKVRMSGNVWWFCNTQHIKSKEADLPVLYLYLIFLVLAFVLESVFEFAFVSVIA